MQKIQTLPLSLTVEAVGAVGSYKHVQDCTFNSSWNMHKSFRFKCSEREVSPTCPTLQHQLPPLDIASGMEGEERLFSVDSGEGNKASGNTKVIRRGFFASHALCSCSYPALYHSCAVPKTLKGKLSFPSWTN